MGQEISGAGWQDALTEILRANGEEHRLDEAAAALAGLEERLAVDEPLLYTEPLLDVAAGRVTKQPIRPGADNRTVDLFIPRARVAEFRPIAGAYQPDSPLIAVYSERDLSVPLSLRRDEAETTESQASITETLKRNTGSEFVAVGFEQIETILGAAKPRNEIASMVVLKAAGVEVGHKLSWAALGEGSQVLGFQVARMATMRALGIEIPEGSDYAAADLAAFNSALGLGPAQLRLVASPILLADDGFGRFYYGAEENRGLIETQMGKIFNKMFPGYRYG